MDGCGKVALGTLFVCFNFFSKPEALTCQSDVTNAHCNSAQDPKAYVIKAELEMQKATSLGLSFSICSQDEGAPSEQNESCQLDSTQPVW